MHGYLTVSHEYGLLQWSELDFFFFLISGGIFKICLFHVLVMFSFDSKFSLQVRSLCLPRSPPLLQCLGRPDLTSQWEEKAGRRREDIQFLRGVCPAQCPRLPSPAAPNPAPLIRLGGGGTAPPPGTRPRAGPAPRADPAVPRLLPVPS